MFGRRMLGLIATIVTVRAQASPEPSERIAMIEAIREQALAYSKHLPNFICTQVTRRELAAAPDAVIGVKSSKNGITGVRGLGQWQLSDTVEEQLTFFDRHENYKLLKLNGKAAMAGQSPPPGLASNGEFGTTLDSIFEPETQAQFEWKRWDTLRGRPVSVFTYRVEKSRSMSRLSTPSSNVVVAYHGLIYADRDTKTVLRLTTAAEAPSDFPLQDVTHILDYALFSIGGERFVLPSYGEMQSRASEEFFKSGKPGLGSRQLLMRNRIDFRGYRKYTADAELKVDPEK